MRDKISLPPITIAGIYYSLTYSKQVGIIKVEQNGKHMFSLQGMKAREFIEMLETTNGYDTIQAILTHWRRKTGDVKTPVN